MTIQPSEITVTRSSKIFMSEEAAFYQLQGWITYRRLTETTVNMTFIFGGEQEARTAITITLPDQEGAAYFGGDYFFGGDIYFGKSSTDPLARQQWGPVAGRGSFAHVNLEITGAADWEIHDIIVRWRTADHSREASRELRTPAR